MTKFERNRTIRGGVIAISIFDLITLMTVNMCYVLRSAEIICTKFDLRQLIRALIIAFFDAKTLCRAVTLIFDPLTLKVCGTTSVTWSEYVRNLSEIKQSPTIIANFEILFAHITSRCDRDLWPLDLEHLQHFGCHVCKFCIKFERNRIIHSWVIDDLARFRRAILGSGELLPNGFQGCLDPTSTNLAKT